MATTDNTESTSKILRLFLENPTKELSADMVREKLEGVIVYVSSTAWNAKLHTLKKQGYLRSPRRGVFKLNIADLPTKVKYEARVELTDDTKIEKSKEPKAGTQMAMIYQIFKESPDEVFTANDISSIADSRGIDISKENVISSSIYILRKKGLITQYGHRQYQLTKTEPDEALLDADLDIEQDIENPEEIQGVHSESNLPKELQRQLMEQENSKATLLTDLFLIAGMAYALMPANNMRAKSLLNSIMRRHSQYNFSGFQDEVEYQAQKLD